MIIPVLGCGPAGLIVAHAVAVSGHEPVIYSRKKPSTLYGAQYLHHPCGFLDLDPIEVEYIKIGDAVGYAEKIYGDRLAPEETSWYQFDGRVQAWNLNQLYAKLWQQYRSQVNDVDITASSFWLEEKDEIVFSTIPRQALYADPSQYEWHSEAVMVELCPSVPPTADKRGYILYNGHPDVPWYRESSLFGHRSREYAALASVPAGTHVHRVVKPVSTNAPEIPGVYMFGRYGKWLKGELVDHAFNQALEILKSF